MDSTTRTSRFLDLAESMGFLTPEESRDATSYLEETPTEPGGVADRLVERSMLTPSQVDRVCRAMDDSAEAEVREVALERDRFEFGEILGRGGMGQVHAAVDRRLRREVAIKRLLPDGSAAGRVRRFVEEAQVTGQLEHPNIVPVHELGLESASARPFLVMKRVRGRSLDRILEGVAAGRASGLGPPGAAETPDLVRARLLGVFVKVCDAVAYAHSRGVLHRDLKPANVMVGEFGEVLVMDWGLARVTGRGEEPVETDRSSDPQAPDRTTDGNVPGTPFYMSPEQASGVVELGPASDVYALGGLLYEMLALVRPVEGTNLFEVLGRIRSGRIDPPPARSRAPWSIPRELEAAVSKAMALVPGERYPSATALATDVESFLAGGTLAAADYSPWQLLAKWAARHRTPLLGAAATFLALLLGGAGVLHARRAERARAIEARRASAEATWAGAGAGAPGGGGGAAGDEAGRESPFHPATAQEHFRRHLAGLLRMGRGLQEHPDPPTAWREEVVRRADALRERAQTTGDWALAAALAESVETWGAAGAADRDERLAAVDRAREETARLDRDRLSEVLRRIEEAEGRGERYGLLAPGVLQETARRMAAVASPAATEAALRLAAGGEVRGTGRRFLVELLGRRGDPVTRSEGRAAPDLVASALDEDPRGASAEERATWILAAARLEAAAPGCVAGIEGRLERERSNAGLAALAAEEAAAFLARIRGGSRLPSPALEPEAFRTQVDDLADWLLASVASGPDYTRFLLDLAEDPARPTRACRFVLDQIGFHGDSVAPDPARPARTAVTVLREIFARLPLEWLSDARPDDADPETWSRARLLGIAAAENLSRLGDPVLARGLDALRVRAGVWSTWRRATRIAFALAPLDAWGEPATALDRIDRGRARLEQDDLDGAIRDFDRALEAEPGSATALVQRGIARTRSGDRAGGLADLDRALELDPGRSDALRLRGTVRALAGDGSGALADYDAALARTPDDLEARNDRAVLRWQAGDRKGAQADLDRVLELCPGYGLAHLNRGNVRRESGDLEGAIADYGRSIALDPDEPKAYERRGTALAELGRAREALADLGRAIAVAPWAVEPRVARARLRFLAGDREGALADLDQALGLDPALAEARLDRAKVRRAAGDLAGCEADLETAMASRPADPRPWALRGALRRGQGRLDEAASDLDRAIELAPDRANLAYGERAILRLDAGDAAGALADLDRALSIDPSSWRDWANRAVALHRQGSIGDALASIEEALRRAPERERPALLAAKARIEGGR